MDFKDLALFKCYLSLFNNSSNNNNIIVVIVKFFSS